MPDTGDAWCIHAKLLGRLDAHYYLFRTFRLAAVLRYQYMDLLDSAGIHAQHTDAGDLYENGAFQHAGSDP